MYKVTRGQIRDTPLASARGEVRVMMRVSDERNEDKHGRCTRRLRVARGGSR